MKKIVLFVTVFCVATFGVAFSSNAVSLTHIYDFNEQLANTPTVFEGLAFTNDGTLWITSAPNAEDNAMLAVDLERETVLSISENPLINPVALASDGTDLFIGDNMKDLMGFDLPDNVYIGTSTNPTVGATISTVPTFTLLSGECTEPEGSAFLNEFLYFSCEEDMEVIKVDPGTGVVVDRISFDQNLLGLGATETSLIVGKYGVDPLDRSLELYDVATGERELIDLNDLFVGTDSDYFALTGGELYNEYGRQIPDPDGLAYKDGKIYMTFEHDLRVFEISLDPPVVPEPGTLLLLGVGLAGLAAFVRKNRF